MIKYLLILIDIGNTILNLEVPKMILLICLSDMNIALTNTACYQVLLANTEGGNHVGLSSSLSQPEYGCTHTLSKYYLVHPYSTR